MLGWLGLFLLMLTAVTLYGLYHKALQEEGKHLEFLVEIQTHYLESLLSASSLNLAVSNDNIFPQSSNSLLSKNSTFLFRDGSKISFIHSLPVWQKKIPFSGKPQGSVPTLQQNTPTGFPSVESSKGPQAFIGWKPQGPPEIVAYLAVKGTPYWVLGVQDLKDIQRPFLKAGLIACLFQGAILTLGFFILKRLQP